MRLLLDTHAVIWATIDPNRLSARARREIEAPSNELVVSAATAYEIEFKREREPAFHRLPHDLEKGLAALGFEWLPVSPAHAAAAGRLPRHHGDPFDRLLIAQAVMEGIVLLSADRRLSAYDAEVIW